MRRIGRLSGANNELGTMIRTNGLAACSTESRYGLPAKRCVSPERKHRSGVNVGSANIRSSLLKTHLPLRRHRISMTS